MAHAFDRLGRTFLEHGAPSKGPLTGPDKRGQTKIVKQKKIDPIDARSIRLRPSCLPDMGKPYNRRNRPDKSRKNSKNKNCKKVDYRLAPFGSLPFAAPWSLHGQNARELEPQGKGRTDPQLTSYSKPKASGPGGRCGKDPRTSKGRLGMALQAVSEWTRFQSKANPYEHDVDRTRCRYNTMIPAREPQTQDNSP